MLDTGGQVHGKERQAIGLYSPAPQPLDDFSVLLFHREKVA
jgi:hypothetical protein